MENSMLDEQLTDGVKIVSVGNEKKTMGTKAFLIGASVVGAGWLLTGLYKKFKKQKTEETEPEEVEELE
jgi:hypothetical protein